MVRVASHHHITFLQIHIFYSHTCLCSGKQQQDLEARLASLEEQCKDNEKGRVDLELQLTEVKENLKKSLAGGPSLGLTVTGKAENPVSIMDVTFHIGGLTLAEISCNQSNCLRGQKVRGVLSP